VRHRTPDIRRQICHGQIRLKQWHELGIKPVDFGRIEAATHLLEEANDIGIGVARLRP
jgi:hypothetical protein